MFSQEDFESDDDDDVSDDSADDDDEEALYKDKEIPVAIASELQHLNPSNDSLSLSVSVTVHQLLVGN